MSKSKIEREEIYNYIIEQIDKDNKNWVKKTCDCFSVSSTTCYRYIKKLVSNNYIIKDAEQSCKYRTVYITKNFSVFDTANNLDEEIIYKESILPYLNDLTLNENVKEIWRYAFTEIMNNAIEHSKATKIYCQLLVSKTRIRIFIIDNGIGIFKKIQQFFKEKYSINITEEDALKMLMPGKLTTDLERHTGEGIFFSSRIVDVFVIFSFGKVFTHTAFNENFFNVDPKLNLDKEGTVVMMDLSANSKKDLTDLFNKYSDVDKGFFKTIIPVKSVFDSGFPVSRSEARRLISMTKNFEEVILDFEGVEKVGQAFCHELFIVNKHLNDKFSFINADEEVDNMIKRVKNTPEIKDYI